MSKAGKITAAISGAFLLLIVVAIILIATFDWNRLKPTINQKVSAELNRPFAIRGDLGVVWERQKQETGWRTVGAADQNGLATVDQTGKARRTPDSPL